MNPARTFGALAVLGLAAGQACFGGEARERGASAGSGGEAGHAIQVGVGGTAGAGGACVDVVVEAEVTRQPVDILVMVDNSGSMVDEVAGVEANINVNFASVLEDEGVDYRVIMITDHGPDRTFSQNVCVGPPLADSSDCNGPPGIVPGQFYHYDVHLESHNALQAMMATMFGIVPDEWMLAPNGWNEWLRTGALKVLVVVTDDMMGYPALDQGDVAVGGAVALAFDDELLSLNPAQFGGSPAQRHYVFYSIVGLASKADPLAPYDAAEPVIADRCSTADSAGTGYQALSNLTGGLRFPVCNHQSYDAVFEHIAASVIDVSAIPCQLDIPAPPAGETLDLDVIEMLFTPSDGDQEKWHAVASAELCDDTAFFVDPLGQTLQLCPGACAKLQADLRATLALRIPCDMIAD